MQTTPSKFKGWVLRRRRSRPHATTHLLAPYRSAVAAAVQHAYAALYYHLLRRRMARKAVAAHPTAVAAAVLGAFMLCCYLLFASHSAFRCGWQALVLRLRVDFNCLTVCVFCAGRGQRHRPLEPSCCPPLQPPGAVGGCCGWRTPLWGRHCRYSGHLRVCTLRWEIGSRQFCSGRSGLGRLWVLVPVGPSCILDAAAGCCWVLHKLYTAPTCHDLAFRPGVRGQPEVLCGEGGAARRWLRLPGGGARGGCWGAELLCCFVWMRVVWLGAAFAPRAAAWQAVAGSCALPLTVAAVAIAVATVPRLCRTGLHLLACRARGCWRATCRRCRPTCTRCTTPMSASTGAHLAGCAVRQCYGQSA